MAERKTAANAAAETEKSSLSQREPMERTENGGPSAQILSGAPMPPLGAKGGGAAGAAPGGSARRTVTLRLPRARAGEEDTVFVGVNGRAWRIRRGVTVEVPRSVAEVLRNGMSAEERAELYKATLS
ncbi:MAG: hypothetical protein IKH56_06200 [Oscillospiraceae bacterium]|nr:hypothetical protein [Oscillospiraceae bacterium]